MNSSLTQNTHTQRTDNKKFYCKKCFVKFVPRSDAYIKDSDYMDEGAGNISLVVYLVYLSSMLAFSNPMHVTYNRIICMCSGK